MSQVAATAQNATARNASARSAGFIAAGLRSQARELHQPRLLWLNVAWLCVAAALAASLIGIFAVATVSPPPLQPDADLMREQIVHLGVGVVAALILIIPRPIWIQRASYLLLALAVVLLIFVLLPGVPDSIVRPRNGARAWINVGFTNFQPSELAKIAYVLALANYLRTRRNYRTFLGLLIPLVLTFIPLGLILKEPDLGTALVFLPTFFAVAVAAGAKLKHIIIILVLGMAMVPLTYPLLKPYQKDRIEAMIAQLRGDDRHANDIGYQADRAMTLAAAGGLFGAGGDHARDLIRYNSLPEAHNDMIFAVICCRWGLLGALTLWLAYFLFTIGGVLTAAMTKDPFGRLVAVGVVAMLFTQMAINTGMVVGLLPITGITLPFVSHGGTSLVVTWMMVGLLLNIAMRRNRYLARQSFEFDEPVAAPERYELVGRSRGVASTR